MGYSEDPIKIERRIKIIIHNKLSNNKPTTSSAIMASKAIRITYVNDAVISRRLWGIYSKILRRDIVGAKVLLNDTIWTLSYAETENPKISSACIDSLYRVLVDLAFKRVDDAHSKLRDLYYNIEEPYFYQPENLIDTIIEA